MPCAHAVQGMDTYRAPKAKPDHADDADDSDELAVFAAERYFYGDVDDDALWPWERSSSSLSSSAFRTTGTHERDRSVPTPTAATSSSEASWNSRSALLPNDETAEKSHAVAAAAAATPVIEERPSDAEGQPAGCRPASSSSNLRRWLLGVAACGCAGGASEEPVTAADEMETCERLPKAESPEATAARSSATPASGRWLLKGDRTTALAGMDGHRRATTKAELSTPISQAAAASDSDERRRIKSSETFQPVPAGDRGSALGSATQSSGFTIVAGSTALGGDARRAAGAGGGGAGSPGEDDDAAPTPSELGCAAYPPSEASVVWSVVTADGAASGNFSSAASGYYHHHYCFNDVDGGAVAHRNTHRRRSGIPGGSSLLMCMSDKAVDAVGPAPSVHRQDVLPAMLGASGGSRNGHGVYKPART